VRRGNENSPSLTKQAHKEKLHSLPLSPVCFPQTHPTASPFHNSN
jgi:hypothetical protein